MEAHRKEFLNKKGNLSSGIFGEKFDTFPCVEIVEKYKACHETKDEPIFCRPFEIICPSSQSRGGHRRQSFLTHYTVE